MLHLFYKYKYDAEAKRMDKALSWIQELFSGMANGFEKLVSSLTSVQLLIVVAGMIVILIALCIALASRGRRIERMRDRIDRVEHAAREKVRAAEDETGLFRRQMAEKQAQIDELTRFHDEYSVVGDARLQAQQIIKQAKDHAFVLVSRADKTFEEMSRQMDEEARRSHELYQEHRLRSYDMLKQARQRANEIVQEASAEANGIASQAYIPGGTVHVIDAPAAQEETDAQAAPDAFKEGKEKDEPPVNPDDPYNIGSLDDLDDDEKEDDPEHIEE
jgi:cell division septum initiation protein DivIVA